MAESQAALGIDPSRIQRISVEQLDLDRRNPRLAWREVSEFSDVEVLRVLWKEMAVDEVAMSIAANGYFPSEPLLWVEAGPGRNGRKTYTVVEGNRRLAAVKLLLDAALREKVRATELPQISDERRDELQYIPAIIHADRRDIWAVLGFRHINGIHPWDSLSKAQYVASVHENYGIELDEIADQIGDRHSTVKRFYRGLKLLQQGEAKTDFDRSRISAQRLYFSHIYTAADQREFQVFLGITGEGSLTVDPVPVDHLSKLYQLLTWLYGSPNTPAVVRTQNPDLNTLREVVADPRAVAVLNATGRLDDAFNVAVGDSQRFVDALIGASRNLRQAMETVANGYTGSTELDRQLDEIVRLVRSLRNATRAIRVHLGLDDDDL